MWYTKEPNKFFQQYSFLIQFEPMTILPDLSDLVIEQVSMTNDVTVTVRAASPTASCPCCGTISKRVQSRYTRTLRDLPTSGRLVHLIVRVRRFFCQENACIRKIFALSLSFFDVASGEIHLAAAGDTWRDGLRIRRRSRSTSGKTSEHPW